VPWTVSSAGLKHCDQLCRIKDFEGCERLLKPIRDEPQRTSNGDERSNRENAAQPALRLGFVVLGVLMLVVLSEISKLDLHQYLQPPRVSDSSTPAQIVGLAIGFRT
jgi:hypothetical protein